MEEQDSVSRRMHDALQKTGYPLEMRVARAAREHRPAHLEQSRYYVDPSTRKVRETDVLTSWMSLHQDPRTRVTTWTHIYLAIECKSKPAPWVIFDDGGGMTDDPAVRLDMAVTIDGSENGYLHAKLEMRAATNTLFAPSRIGSGIAEPMAKNAENGDPAWSAVRAAVSAAHGVLADFDLTTPKGDGQVVNMVVQPVVVTSGSLCRAYLDEDGGLQVEQVERGEITVRRDERARLTRCLVVTEAYLGDLMRTAAQTADFYGFRG